MLCTVPRPMLDYDCGCLYTQFIRFATHCSRLHAVSFISGATFCYKTLFSICAHITQLATPITRTQPSPVQPIPVPDPSVLSVWPTYLAFVFIFSVIVLFLPSQFLQPTLASRLPPLAPLRSPLAACVHATYHLWWVRSDHSLRSVFRLMLLIIITSIMTGFNWRQQRLRQLLVMKLVCHSRPGTGTGPIRP